MIEDVPPDPDDPRIVPLARKRTVPSSASPARADESPASLTSTEEEIVRLFGEAKTPSDSPPRSDGLPAYESAATLPTLRGPPPHHHHAEVCPQCEAWTWRHTECCVHCGFNLFEYAQCVAQDQARQQRMIEREWIMQFLVVLVVVGLAAVALSRIVRQPFSGWLLIGGFGMLLAAAMIGKERPPPL